VTLGFMLTALYRDTLQK